MTTNSLNNECLNDFTVTSDSTTARVLTVENTSNTGSSDAALIVTVGSGGAAGDAYTRYELGTTAQYAIGIDNTDSDQFKITYGTSSPTPSSGTEVLTSHTTGNMQYPATAMFRAYLGTTKTNVTGDDTEPVYTIPYDTEDFDIGSNFNSTTGVFTAPVTGRYFFVALCRLGGITDQDLGGSFLKSTSGVLTRFDDINWTSVLDITNSEINIYVYILAELSANDTMHNEIFIHGGANSQTVDVLAGTNETFFAGFLVG